MKYEELNKAIIDLIGGKDNIITLTHCVTRLRFKLKDRNKPKTEEIRKLDDVIDVLSNDVAYQVIIGTQVGEVYEELVQMIDIDQNNNQKAEKPRNAGAYITSILAVIGDSINPFLEVLLAAGVISSILSIASVFGLLEAYVSPTYNVLDALSSGVFTYLPVLIAAGLAKRLNISPYIAMALTFAMVIPSIDGVEGLSLFGISLQTVTYTRSFIPSLLGVWILSIVIKTLNKVMPKKLHFFLVPSLALLITYPIVLFFFGPIGNVLSEAMGAAFMWILNTFGLPVASAIKAAVNPIIMITGAGAFMTPITLNNLSMWGYDPLLPTSLISDMAVGGAALGYYLRARKEFKKIKTPEREKELELFGTTSFSAIMGITEPALYGVFAKFRRPFIATICAGLVGGTISGLMGVKTYGYVWGLMSFPTYMTGGIMNQIGIIVAVAAGFVTSVLVAYGIGIPRDKKEKIVSIEKVNSNMEKVILKTVTEGKVIPLNKVKDRAFASEAIGKGIAIIPEDKEEIEIKAPASGVIASVFPTKHAYGIKTEEGIEILIHIGLDTVNLEGKYFEACVKEGQQVTCGDTLCSFNAKEIKREGFDTTVIVVITNTKDFLDVIPSNDDTSEIMFVLM